MERKAQVGSTLTWIVAFVIIFFILLLFLAVTSGLAKAKQIPVLSWFLSSENKLGVGEDVSLEGGMKSMKVQREIIKLLNTRIKDPVSVYNPNYVDREAGMKEQEALRENVFDGITYRELIVLFAQGEPKEDISRNDILGDVNYNAGGPANLYLKFSKKPYYYDYLIIFGKHLRDYFSELASKDEDYIDASFVISYEGKTITVLSPLPMGVGSDYTPRKIGAAKQGYTYVELPVSDSKTAKIMVDVPVE